MTTITTKHRQTHRIDFPWFIWWCLCLLLHIWLCACDRKLCIVYTSDAIQRMHETCAMLFALAIKAFSSFSNNNTQNISVFYLNKMQWATVFNFASLALASFCDFTPINGAEKKNTWATNKKQRSARTTNKSNFAKTIEANAHTHNEGVWTHRNIYYFE